VTVSPLNRDLLAHIIDYAGTFPPANLPMGDALMRYTREQAGSDAWLLGRFVVRAEDLNALGSSTKVEPYDFSRGTVGVTATVGLDFSRANSPGEWQLSVVAGPDAQAALGLVDTFNARWAGRFKVAAVEFSPSPPADIAGLARFTGDTIGAFFETPIDADLEVRLDAICAAGAAAKVRTGGTTASAIPSASALADFLSACAQRQLPFKATAGLHHAVRSCYPLTYERNSPTAEMHGFLNVVAAAALAVSGARRDDIVSALVEPSAQALTETARRSDPRATRRFFRSFGSCSFREPADELARRGVT
jgi:hypothetical protein